MPRNTYLFENRMFTIKVKHSIIWGERKSIEGKEKKELALIKRVKLTQEGVKLHFFRG